MPVHWWYNPIFACLFLAECSQQVDITISAFGTRFKGNAVGIYTNRVAGTVSVEIATCPNIPPGECCQPPLHFSPQGATVTFRGLLAMDIAAVWTARPNAAGPVTSAQPGAVHGCADTILDSKAGPGEWMWQAADGPAESTPGAAGASFISVPTRLPPDDGTARWMLMEGLLGLVWNGGKWFSSPGAEKMLGPRKMRIRSGSLRYRRDVHSADKGKVYARPPLRVRYPSLVEINGTQYTGDGTSDFRYTDSAGNVVDLTEWFRS
ncbi:MAG: hypothetical protein Q9174_000447 [Haloplaca sp. 1 TL-2023]